MPIAKSVPVTTPEIVTQPEVKQENRFVYDGIPLDIAQYFQVNMFQIDPKVKVKLQDIYKWSRSNLEEDTIGNNLHKIAHLDSKLGTAMHPQGKLEKMWSWVRLQSNIDELRKRQSAFER